MKKNKVISVILSVVVVLGALTYLMVSSFGETMIYYKTVNELLAEPQRFENRPVRINGVLVSGSIRQKPGTDQFRFKLKKQGQILEVAYAGILPDAMQPDRELVVQGKLQTGHKLFVASEILTKCPSKHEAKAKAIGP